MNFIPFLPHSQNRKLWEEATQPKTHYRLLKPIADKLTAAIEKSVGSINQEVTPTTTTIPDLPGSTPLEKVANLLNQDHLRVYLDELATNPPLPFDFSPVFQSGWVRYSDDGVCRVPFPTEKVFFFDTETVVKCGNDPILGVALSSKAWYIWMSEAMVGGSLGDLIPLDPASTFIAHNALFDMSKVKGAYQTSQNKPQALCTMAMHTTMSGMGGEQVMRLYKSLPVAARYSDPGLSKCCPDGLDAVVHHYTGTHLSKEARNLFVHGTLTEIVDGIKYGEQLTYAINDVAALALLWIPLWSKFKVHCPSDITLSGLLASSRTLLPVKDYRKRVQANTLLYQSKMQALEKSLTGLAESLITDWQGGLDVESDPWYCQLDWSVAKTGKRKGQPLWYRNAKGKVTLKSQLVPLLTKMQWKGEPVEWDKKMKWCYRVDGELQRLPHPDGKGANLGSMVSKHLAPFAESGVLSSQHTLNLPLELSRLAYWSSFQSRFEGEYVKGDFIVPVTRVVGTLTGRKVNGLWLTAAQTKPGRLGTDLFHTIQAPEGYSFVHGDMDTQEMRIASVWADYNVGYGLGCTPMSQCSLLGEKSLGTDAHSVTAKGADLPRQDAKVANFLVLFGGGSNAQCAALSASHPDWEDSKVSEVVDRVLKATRGVKSNGVWAGGTDSAYHNEATIIANTRDFRLPMTGRQIPHVVNARNDFKKRFFTSRYNFPVQGSGADLLHCLLGLVGPIAEMFGLTADDYFFVLDRHDEYCFCVKDSGVETFAEVMNTCHLLAWACLLDSLGFNWMTHKLCRFSEVCIDKVYRKEVSAPTDAGYGLGWEFANGKVIS